MARFPQFAEAVDYARRADFARMDREGRQKWKNWQQELAAKANDTALMRADYFRMATDIGVWPTVAVPGPLHRLPPFRDFRGALWLAREFDVPPEVSGGATFKLRLGTIHNTATIWINGERIGATAYNDRKSLAVPPNLIRPGKNRIVIRAVNSNPSAIGMVGAPADLSLETPNGSQIQLAGDWHYQIEVGFDPETLPAEPYWRVMPEGTPSWLFNGGIAPVIPYGIRGVIWYQGESNAPRAVEYRQLLPAMIADWRARWGQGDFPFYQVQLAGYRSIPESPGEDEWAELREAQARVASEVPHAGMATAIDIGMTDFIHPLNKQEVGRRLGLVAQALTYSAAVEFSGPVFRELKITGNRAVLHFDHLGGGLVSRDTEHAGALRSFAVAGQDRAWHWADAVIDGTTVVVSCADVPEPVAVRYGWATNIACDFYNQAGLPAVPFRTDDWPLTTGDQIYHPGGNFLKAWQSEVTQQRANTPAPNPQAPQP